MRILIIEDEEHIREVAQVSLQAVAGWQVATAPSGRDGIDAAARHRPDVILLDVMMPDLDGPATLRELRARPDTAVIPVIFLTAKLQPLERRNLESLGAQGVIGKPFDPMTLADRIAEVLGWTR